MNQIERSIKVSELKKMYEKGELQLYLKGFDKNIVSRTEEWDLKTKSSFLISILNKMIIPQIYIYKNEDGCSYIIDGRQRLLTLFKFIDNKFAISEEVIKEPFDYLKNKAFKHLDIKIQNEILNYEIKTVEQTGSIEESLETFVNINGGISVKPIEIFRAKIGRHLTLLEKICNHDIFELLGINKENLSIKYDMALYFLMLEANPGTGLSKKEKEDFISSLSRIKSLNENISINLFKKLDYLFEAFNNYEYNSLPKGEKYLKRSHIIIIYKFITRAIDQGIKPRGFFNWCNTFFYTKKNPRNNYWIESSRGSTTSKNSMNIKFECLRDSFLLYFSKREDDINKYIFDVAE
ncbi:MAG: DUF262 domain-containing protein [Clostridiales bacterium]|nr:DUF262 domain-containing protein [Clostridiales bacterium]